MWFRETDGVHPWLFTPWHADLFDLQIWRELREAHPKFSIMKYFILDWVHANTKQAYIYRDEFEKWLGIRRNPTFASLSAYGLASRYHTHYTTITRHLAYLIENGFVLKDKFGTCLADDTEELFLNSTKNVEDEHILVFERVFLRMCKSTEEALVLSYVLKRLIDTDIKRISISEIKKTLLLDPKTVNRALINLENNSYVKVDKRNVSSTYFATGRYRNIRDKFKKNGNMQL